MKKSLFLLSVLSVSLSAWAEMNPCDTIVVRKPNVVTVVTNDSLQAIKVEGKEGNPKFTYQSKIELTDSNYVSESGINSNDFSFRFGMPRHKADVNKKGNCVVTTNIFVGFLSAPGLPRPAEVQAGKSVELLFMPMNFNYSPWKAGKHTFSLGLGLDWRMVGLTRANKFLKTNGELTFGNYADGVRPKESILTVFSLSFPLMYNYYSHGCGWSVGPVFNFNTYSSIVSKWKDDGRDVKEKMKNVYVRPFTVDMMVSVRTEWIGLYLKYSPANMIKADHGMKFHMLSFGFWF